MSGGCLRLPASGRACCARRQSGARCWRAVEVSFEQADPRYPVAELFEGGNANRGVARKDDTVQVDLYYTTGVDPDGGTFVQTLSPTGPGIKITLQGKITSAYDKVLLPMSAVWYRWGRLRLRRLPTRVGSWSKTRQPLLMRRRARFWAPQTSFQLSDYRNESMGPVQLSEVQSRAQAVLADADIIQTASAAASL